MNRPRRNRTARLLLAASAVASFFVVATTGAGASTPTSSPKCPATSLGSTTLTPVVGGVQRTVIVHAPKRLSPTVASPLVLNLHGSGSTAVQQEGLSGMNKTANSDGFIVAYPQAILPDGSGFDWNIPGVPLIGGRAVPKGAANDVSFLTKLVSILEKNYCINAKEVFATGLSGGAREVSQLACDDSSIFAAIAPVSGLRRPLPCPTSRAVSVITFHGSADPIDPFNGHGQAYWTYSVPTAAKDWAHQDRCATNPKESSPDRNVDLTSYGNCANGAQVELYEIIGEGHEWPGGPTLPSGITALLGPQSNALSANATMWAFFSSHPL
jgi:polyhydroxybutyrate depolymerase